MNWFKKKRLISENKDSESNPPFAEYRLSVSGAVFIALGGYTAEYEGKNSKENAEKVVNTLIDFMTRNKFGILCFDNKLEFVPVELFEKTKK